MKTAVRSGDYDSEGRDGEGGGGGDRGVGKEEEEEDKLSEASSDHDHDHDQEHDPSSPHDRSPMRPKPFVPKRADKGLRLQLYRYRKHGNGMLGFLQRTAMQWQSFSNYANLDVDEYKADEVPEVYMQWRMQRKKAIDESYLTIKAGPCSAALIRSSNISSFPVLHGAVAAGLEIEVSAKSKQEMGRQKAAILRRSRQPTEPCVVPDKLLHRLEVGPQGAMVVSFSHHGHILAVAAAVESMSQVVPLAQSSNPMTVYCIKLFDPDYNEELFCFNPAHHGVIYELKWSKNDRYLLSSSGDGTVKVWDLIGLSPYHHMLAGARGSPRGGKGGNVNAYILKKRSLFIIKKF